MCNTEECLTNNKNTGAKHKLSIFIKVVLLALIFGVIVFVSVWDTDTDIYFLIAEGREIIKDGIPYNLTSFNYFPIETVIQQYGWCVVLAVAYDNLGNIGLMLLQMVIVAFTAFINYSYLMLRFREIDRYYSVFLSLLSLTCVFLNLRPELLTYCLLISQLLITEKIIQTKKCKYVFCMIPVMLLEMQVHMSLWIFHAILLLPYICPVRIAFEKNEFFLNVKKKRELWILCLPKKERFVLIVGIILSFMSILLNPYGLDGVFYIFRTSKVWDFNIAECRNVSYFTLQGIIILICVCLFILTCKKLRSSDIYLCVGIMFMGVVSYRNSMLMPIVILILFGRMLRAQYYTKRALAVIFVLLLINIRLVPVTNELSNESYNELAVIISNIEDKNSKIYCIYEQGNYLEYMGYKTFFDARPEIYSIKINKTRDVAEDFLILYRAKEQTGEVIDFYRFDYMIVYRYSALYYYLCKDNSRYYEVDATESLALFEARSSNG